MQIITETKPFFGPFPLPTVFTFSFSPADPARTVGENGLMGRRQVGRSGLTPRGLCDRDGGHPPSKNSSAKTLPLRRTLTQRHPQNGVTEPLVVFTNDCMHGTPNISGVHLAMLSSTSSSFSFSVVLPSLTSNFFLMKMTWPTKGTESQK